MTERIVERISRRKNDDILGWYQTKVNAMAHFLIRRIKEDTSALKVIESKEYEELEVAIK